MAVSMASITSTRPRWTAAARSSRTAVTSITCRRVRTMESILCQGVKRAMDAGALAIHLEEPEFWVRGGYGPGFQRAVEIALP